MCGITGFVSDKEIDLKNFYKSHLLIKHRGPDDEGFVLFDDNNPFHCKGDDTIEHFQSLPHIRSFNKARTVLGHRRLSIIDLSHYGHQPMSDESSRYFIVYNGEIFNYVELRKELEKHNYRFNTRNDTEVVLKAYMHWKEEAFNKFNGMWALAIYDKKKNKLILSRDRFGIKPLYYAYIYGTLYFASEIKFIKSFVNYGFKINKNSVKAYIESCLINYSEETFWENIYELEPGHYLTYQESNIKIKKYWAFEPKELKYSNREALEKFAYLFEDSLKLRMRADVEVGSLLSGGLDSTLIVCTLNKLGFIKDNNFKTFSAVFEEEEFSEKKYIDETLKLVPLKPYFTYPSPYEVKKYLSEIFYYNEEPLRSLAVYSQYLLYKSIKDNSNIKVVLNGQGADEMFGGYTGHYRLLFYHLIKKGKILRFLKEMNLYRKKRNNNFSHIINNSFFINLIKFILYKNSFNISTFHEIIKSALREYLRYDDRNSMAFSIEARVPFLDYRLVEFAFSLGVSHKIDNFTNKKIQRDYAANIIPDIILNRTDKMGFVSPQEVWQKNQIKKEIEDSFSNLNRMLVFDLYSKEKIMKNYKEYITDKSDNWPYIWRIYCMEQWLKTWTA